MFKLCVAALVLAVAIISVNGYHYYPGYVGLDGRAIAPLGVRLVDEKSDEKKIERVADISLLDLPRAYYPYHFGYTYGYPTHGSVLRIARDTEDVIDESKKLEGN